MATMRISRHTFKSVLAHNMIYNVHIHIRYTIYIIYLYIGSHFLVSHLVTTRDLTCSTWSWSPPRPPRNSTRTPRTPPPFPPPTTSSPDSLARRAPFQFMFELH